MPLSSDTETDIAISGRNLRSLPISVDLVFYIFSVSLFRFSHKLFSIFYARVVAEQNSISINRIKRYATEIDNSKLYVIYKNKKKRGSRMLLCGISLLHEVCYSL